MKYDFDKVLDRHNTNSIKWDFSEKFFSVKDILPMWVADMDFTSPKPVVEAVKKVADFGVYGYGGVPESYCDSVTNWMKKRHDWSIEKDWMVYSPGVVPALHMLIIAFSAPGDQIIVQPPVYFPFFNAIKANNREILENHLILENDQYVMDLENLEKSITPKTKMIILCNPHNPISRVWQKHELARLGELCIKHNLIIVSDEIHGDLVYSRYKHVPFASISQNFADNCIVCTAASKTFNLPGLQTSNIIIPNPDLRAKFKNVVKSFGYGSPNIFGIAATEAAYRFGEPWLTQLLEYLEDNIVCVEDFIRNNIPGLKLIKPQGTYLLWLDFRGCNIDPTKLATFVRQEAKVGLEPGSIFGAKEAGFERMNIACPRITLSEGLQRIAQAVKLLK